MAIEIERKFLVSPDFKKSGNRRKKIIQGYLTGDIQNTVRVRIIDNKGFITVKGPGNKSGLSRFEWEHEIPFSEAEELLLLCQFGQIEKWRYEIVYSGKTFEVDEFLGENEGLLIAELELLSENEVFELPEWILEEVTGDPKYYNLMLSRHPYKAWG